MIFMLAFLSPVHAGWTLHYHRGTWAATGRSSGTSVAGTYHMSARHEDGKQTEALTFSVTDHGSSVYLDTHHDWPKPTMKQIAKGVYFYQSHNPHALVILYNENQNRTVNYPCL